MINFAIVVDQEVLYNMPFDGTSSMGEKWIAILRSNPKMVKISGYAFAPGDILIDGELYRKNISNELDKLNKDEGVDQNTVYFAAIFDDEIAGAMSLRKDIIDQHIIDRVEKAFSSDYKIIEAPIGVSFGWTYDGTTFSELEE
jgi:hypothetical protein